MKIRIVILLFGFMCITSCSNDTQMISIEELQLALNEKNIQLVDARTAEEFKLGHITNAVLIDVMSSDFEKKSLEKLNKSKPVYIYCRSGRRSRKACDILNKKGFRVYNLEGGYLKWKLKNK